ncbi:MAG TPA: AbrB/MazE/SpoVT family DNA-binding domain-containing protein [Dehalococcoidia bacterium]|nr:AbrB/MazE/SpoVT family DNA-binding domain-containing protein [Dehalococcoidia bacterium]
MPILETRRIYAAGRSLAIILPKGWFNYFGLKAGDAVEIVADGNLVIRPVQKAKAGCPEDPNGT